MPWRQAYIQHMREDEADKTDDSHGKAALAAMASFAVQMHVWYQQTRLEDEIAISADWRFVVWIAGWTLNLEFVS